MIASRYRLNTRQITYIQHRRQAIHTDDRLVVYIPQYAHIPYHQVAIQISSKIHKHAVQRNMMRRLFYDISRGYLTTDLGGYYKYIWIPKKTSYTKLSQILSGSDKKLAKQAIIDNIQSNYQKFISNLAKQKSKPGKVSTIS